MLKILLPIGHTGEIEPALCDALRRELGSESVIVHVLYVQHPLSQHVGRFASHEAVHGYYAQRSRPALARATATLRGFDFNTEPHALLGDPASRIVQFADEIKADRIMMASHGMGSISEMLLGSVAAGVLRLSPIPVEVVPITPRSKWRAYAGPAGAGAGLIALLYFAAVE